MTTSDMMAANKIRTCFIRYMKDLFKRVDFIATPTCGQTAELFDENDEKCKNSDAIFSRNKKKKRV